MSLAGVLAREIPGFDPQRMHDRFADLGLDSFGAVTLRGAVEQAIGQEIADDDWLACRTPADLLTLAEKATPAPGQANQAAEAMVRHYRLGMPHLSPHRLSEAWLLRESGDLHWSMIAAALDTQAQAIADGAGNRLYATVSRLAWRAGPSLQAFAEGDNATLGGSLQRHGAGLFLGTQRFDGPAGSVSIEVMTNFAFRDHSAPHGGLMRGQPILPAICDTPHLEQLPAFVSDYREARSRGLPEAAVARCEYRIVPHHDMNAVGLLYFAAYPVIAEICDWQLESGQESGWQPVERDICYLANCGREETLRYTVHSRAEGPDGRRQVASLARCSDGVAIARIATTSVRR